MPPSPPLPRGPRLVGQGRTVREASRHAAREPAADVAVVQAAAGHPLLDVEGDVALVPAEEVAGGGADAAFVAVAVGDVAQGDGAVARVVHCVEGFAAGGRLAGWVLGVRWGWGGLGQAGAGRFYSVEVAEDAVEDLGGEGFEAGLCGSAVQSVEYQNGCRGLDDDGCLGLTSQKL